MLKRNNSTLLRAHSRGSFDRLIFESEHCNGGGGRERGIIFRLCQLLVLVLRVVTPFAYLYLAIFVYYGFSVPYLGDSFAARALTLWMTIEALFFPYYYYIFHTLNDKSPALKHFGDTSEKRRKLVVDCVDAVEKSCMPNISAGYSCTDAQRNVQKMVEGWFLNVPIREIKRDNFDMWCGWAFFDKRDVKSMSVSEAADHTWIVDYVENRARWTFPPGLTPSIPSARLTFDPVFAVQRPFVFYAVIAVVNLAAHAALRVAGYTRRSEYDRDSQGVFHRPAKPRAAVPGSKKPLPLVFLHGIGIGFPHYLGFILSFPEDVDVYLIEWPHVAMQFAASVPSIDDTVEVLTKVLSDDQHPAAVLIGHSLGTTAIAWMLHSSSAHLVAAALLVDPVTFLLCDPTVATSFVYNAPETPLDMLMHFFVSRELFIANALSRHFNWSQNILFVEQLAPDTKLKDQDPSSMHTIILSTHDTIVPTAAVERYLKAKSNEGHTCYEVVSFTGTHGQIMLHPSWIKFMVAKIKVKCGSAA